MSPIDSNKVIVGRKPECGHVVAIDLDSSTQTRREYAKNGYDILTLPEEEALNLFKTEGIIHQRECMKKK